MEQLTLLLSFIALAGFWHTEPGKVSEAVVELMARMQPRQELVWGPALRMPLTDRSGKAILRSDALVFISRDRDTGEYCVVFRGTNPVSSMEWLFQDFKVREQVPWRRISPGRAPEEASISEGAAAALSLRLGLRPEESVAGAGTSLAEALLDIAERREAPCGLTFTGHSLGGLLAPLAALWLVERLEAEGGSAPLQRIEAWTYAAPTAGNRAFAAYLDARLPGHRRYANALDLVPRAWEEEAMASLPSLYGPDIGPQPVARSMLRLGARLAKGGDYAQPGDALPVPAEVIPVLGGLYLLEAAYQHCGPYLDLLPPEEKATILREIYEPLVELVSVKGLRPVELRTLFRAGR